MRRVGVCGTQQPRRYDTGSSLFAVTAELIYRRQTCHTKPRTHLVSVTRLESRRSASVTFSHSGHREQPSGTPPPTHFRFQSMCLVNFAENSDEWKSPFCVDNLTVKLQTNLCSKSCSWENSRFCLKNFQRWNCTNAEQSTSVCIHVPHVLVVQEPESYPFHNGEHGTRKRISARTKFLAWLRRFAVLEVVTSCGGNWNSFWGSFRERGSSDCIPWNAGCCRVSQSQNGVRKTSYAFQSHNTCVYGGVWSMQQQQHCNVQRFIHVGNSL